MREKRCYVASSKETEFVLEDITSFIKNIKKEKDKDIWLVGGGKMINQFITSLIYKCIVTIIPTILGDGILLYLHNNLEIKHRLVETKVADRMASCTVEILREFCMRFLKNGAYAPKCKTYFPLSHFIVLLNNLTQSLNSLG